jgi:hypothetical protein
VALRRLKQLAVERRVKVRHLPPPVAAPGPRPAAARSDGRAAAVR